jgi:hypothetical protein
LREGILWTISLTWCLIPELNQQHEDKVVLDGPVGLQTSAKKTERVDEIGLGVTEIWRGLDLLLFDTRYNGREKTDMSVG